MDTNTQSYWVAQPEDPSSHYPSPGVPIIMFFPFSRSSLMFNKATPHLTFLIKITRQRPCPRTVKYNQTDDVFFFFFKNLGYFYICLSARVSRFRFLNAIPLMGLFKFHDRACAC